MYYYNPLSNILASNWSQLLTNSQSVGVLWATSLKAERNHGPIPCERLAQNVRLATRMTNIRDPWTPIFNLPAFVCDGWIPYIQEC